MNDIHRKDPSELLGRIKIDPQVMLGKPVIRGTRIPVEILLEKLAGDASIEDILLDYPQLERDDVLAALVYARRAVGYRRADFRVGLKLLADHNVEAPIVARLRSTGHDVRTVSEALPPEATDLEVLELARMEERVLLSNDKDFGEPWLWSPRVGSAAGLYPISALPSDSQLRVRGAAPPGASLFGRPVHCRRYPDRCQPPVYSF